MRPCARRVHDVQRQGPLRGPDPRHGHLRKGECGGRHTSLRHGVIAMLLAGTRTMPPTGCPACRLSTCCVQVRSSEGGNGERLPPIDGIPAELQQLLWDCTAHDKRDR